MEGKITLVTPPDVFENNNLGVLFVNISELDQDLTSEWLEKTEIQQDINIYVYDSQHHHDTKWLLYAMNCCNYAFIDLDRADNLVIALSSYMLSISNSSIYYKVSDSDLAETYKLVNLNRVQRIEDFLENLVSE